ncbi:MAG: choice-of-anchor B family protein, partial [Anaerolineales bacterium]|nr:choice-of-anchor B family protein [Anaerolineales bacterium]
MFVPAIKRLPNFWQLMLISAGLLALLAPVAISRAQHEPDTALTASMAALLDDQMPALPLAPLAAQPCVAGFADVYPCENVDLLAFIPLSGMSAGSGNDIWGWTDSSTGNEYALMGLNNGTAFVDITDPVNPIYLGKLPTHTSSSSWRDIKVYADHAYIVSEASGHGMQVFDLTELRNVTNPPVTFTETAHFGGFGSAHNVVINEDSGYAYGVGASTCSGGLHMVDITSPAAPTDAGCFAADGYTHDAQCVIYNGPDTAHQGAEICFNSNEDTLTIVDVSNKAAPAQLSRSGYAGSAYTHQGWLTEDQQYFLLDDELDEQNTGNNTRTYIWDVTDLDSPTLIGSHLGSTAAIDHNMYVHQGVIYQANYRSGLRILEMSDIANGNLSEIAYFDIFPSSDSASFNGAWSVFPYYESGVVVVSGIEQGLFVLQPQTSPTFSLLATETELAVCNTGTPTLALTVNSVLGFADPVTLSAVGVPAGSSAAFSPNPVTPPDNSELTLTVNSTPAGTHPFTVEATAGAITGTVALQLSVFSTSPISPSLTAPADGATDVSFQPTLNWNAVAQGQTYFVELATDAGFSTLVFSDTTTATSVTVPNPLTASTEYFWRVTAANSCGTAPLSATYSFTVQSSESLRCDLAPVVFAEGIPQSWSVTDDSPGGNGITWI